MLHSRDSCKGQYRQIRRTITALNQDDGVGGSRGKVSDSRMSWLISCKEPDWGSSSLRLCQLSDLFGLRKKKFPTPGDPENSVKISTVSSDAINTSNASGGGS